MARCYSSAHGAKKDETNRRTLALFFYKLLMFKICTSYKRKSCRFCFAFVNVFAGFRSRPPNALENLWELCHSLPKEPSNPAAAVKNATPNTKKHNHHSDKTAIPNHQLSMISSESSLAIRKPSRDMAKKRWSRAARAVSRCAVELGLLVSSLHGGVWFCLLCFQPEPVPRSLPARSPQPPPK